MHDFLVLVTRKKYVFCLLALGFFFSISDAQASDPVKGHTLYMQYCNSCHERGRAMAGAPDFSYGSTLMQSDPVLLQGIRSGKNAMPGYTGILSDRMILDIIAYMRTF